MMARIGVLFLLTLVVGCVAVPSQVVMPEAKLRTDAEYEVELSRYRQQIGVYPLETTAERVLMQMNLYLGVWRKHEEALLLGRDIADNATFGGIIGTAALVLSDKLTAAKQVAGGVGILNLGTERYKVQIQAENYRKAAEAVECLRVKVQAVHPLAWEYFDDHGELKFESMPDDLEVLLRLAVVFPDINIAMSRVAGKLRSLQRDTRIAAPTMADITKVLETAREDVIKVKGLANAQSLKMQSLGVSAKAATLAAEAVQSILRLRSEMDTCVVPMG